MSIEHRWTARHPARLLVSIDCRPTGTLKGRLRNISHGGAMVQIHAKLPTNAPVELIVPMRESRGMRSFRVPAIVTRCSKSEVGLMFGRMEPDMWRTLLMQLRPRAGAVKDVSAGVLAKTVPSPSRS